MYVTVYSNLLSAPPFSLTLCKAVCFNSIIIKYLGLYKHSEALKSCIYYCHPAAAYGTIKPPSLRCSQIAVDFHEGQVGQQ